MVDFGNDSLDAVSFGVEPGNAAVGICHDLSLFAQGQKLEVLERRSHRALRAKELLKVCPEAAAADLAGRQDENLEQRCQDGDQLLAQGGRYLVLDVDV